MAARQLSALQHTATHCNTLQYTATCRNTLQHTSTYYNTLQHDAFTHPTRHVAGIYVATSLPLSVFSMAARHLSTPQHTAAHRDTSQHTATHYSTLHLDSCTRGRHLRGNTATSLGLFNGRTPPLHTHRPRTHDPHLQNHRNSTNVCHGRRSRMVVTSLHYCEIFVA